MKSHYRTPNAPSTGFTLVELLVVIAIIGVLAALLFPTLAYIKKKAKLTQARQEMADLLTSIRLRVALFKTTNPFVRANCDPIVCFKS